MQAPHLRAGSVASSHADAPAGTAAAVEATAPVAMPVLRVNASGSKASLGNSSSAPGTAPVSQPSSAFQQHQQHQQQHQRRAVSSHRALSDTNPLLIDSEQDLDEAAVTNRSRASNATAATARRGSVQMQQMTDEAAVTVVRLVEEVGPPSSVMHT